MFDDGRGKREKKIKVKSGAKRFILKALKGEAVLHIAKVFLPLFPPLLSVIESLPSVSLEIRYVIWENYLNLRNVLANVIKLKLPQLHFFVGSVIM